MQSVPVPAFGQAKETGRSFPDSSIISILELHCILQALNILKAIDLSTLRRLDFDGYSLDNCDKKQIGNKRISINIGKMKLIGSCRCVRPFNESG